MYSITVLIVTYKQQDVIGRAIESVLQQKQYGLKEIVICDDCSPDDNWSVINHFRNQYPKIIRAYRNDENLGIYGNSNKLVTLRGNADLFYWLEGDDALCDGSFEAIQSFINSHSVDLNNRSGFFLNWKTVYPNGKEVVFSNKSVTLRKPPFGLYIRGIASWRGAFFTSSVMDCFTPVDISKGLNLAEGLFDSQWFRFTDSLYHVDYVGAIYYAGIGVSTELQSYDSAYSTTEALEKWVYFRDHFADSWRDRMWLNARITRILCTMNPNWFLFFKSIFYYLAGVYYKGSFSLSAFKRFEYPVYNSLRHHGHK